MTLSNLINTLDPKDQITVNWYGHKGTIAEEVPAADFILRNDYLILMGRKVVLIYAVEKDHLGISISAGV